MDDFKKLYDVLVREGKFTKSYDDFQSKWLEDEEYKNKVYDVVVRDGLFTKEKDSFLEKYSLTPQKKNPIEEEEPLGSPLEEVSMDTTEEIGVGDSSIKEDVVNERTIKYPSGILGKEDSVPEPSNTEIYNNRIQEANMKFANTPNKEDQGYVSNVVSSLDRGFGKNLVGNPVKGLGTLIQGTTGAIMGNDGKGVVSDALIKFGTYINNTVDELAPQDEEFKNSLSDQVGQALGQVASLAVTGLATGAAKASNILTNGLSKGGLWESGKIAVKELGKDMVSPVAISGGLSMGQSEFERAIQGGATDNEAFEVFLKNAAVGSVLERVPMMQFFKRLNKASGGGIIDVLRTRGKAGFSGGAEEFTTEVLQGLYANQTAKDIYNINQKLYEGVAEQGGIGFGVGFLLNAIGVRARLSRDNGDTELAETLEAQLDEFKERAESGAAVYNTDYKVSAHKSTLSSDEIEAMISQGDIAGIQKATEEGKINWKSIPQKTKDKLNIDEQTIGETTYSYPTGIYDSYNPSSQQTTNEQTTTDPTGVPSMDEGAEPNVDQVDAEAGLTAEESTDPQQDLIAELNAKRDIELESAKTKKAQKEINKKYDAELEALPTGDLVSGLKGSTYLDEQSDEDFESLLGNPKFKIESKETEEVNTLETNPESIQEEMSKMPESEINFTEPDVSQDGLKVSPVEESNSTTKISKEESDKLSKPIQYFNGIPMIHGMSDMMAAGVITDSEGNPMSVEGGLLYNVLGKNKENAWAGVNYKGAKTQLDNAEKLYKNNKDLFDKLWAEGKLPDGHVPVAIMRMGNTAVNSNEAVFRWISPAVKKLPKKNRTEAVNVLKGIIDNRLTALGGIESLNTGQKAEVKTLSQLQQFIKKNKIKTLDQLIDAIPVDAKRRAKGNEDETLSLDTRGKLYTLLFSPEGTSKASKKPIAALYDGVKNADQSVFTSDVVYKAIGEPSVLRSKKGEVIGVVGIDVKNGEVTEVEHGNYGFGPKGKPIALISNPKHGIDVFPEWRAKASRVFKPTKPKDKTKEPSLPKEQAVADQVGGAFFTDKAFAGSRPAVGEMTDQDVLVGKLRYAFPNVTVAKTQLEFDNIIKSPNVRTKTSEGEVVLGLTLDGKIYLNPSSKSLNTPIHEFGHIWFDFLRSKESGRKGKQLLAKGLELVTGTTEHNKAMEMYGDTELAKEEALVELMASKGETLIGKAKKEFKSWMNGLFKYIKEKFVGTEDLRMVDIKDMSLDDFVNTGLSDLFKGKSVDKKNRDPEPDPEVSFKKVAKPKESNTSEQPQVRFKKQAESTDLDDATQLRNLLVDNQDLIMNEVVFKKLQENGVSDARVNKFRALARNLVKTTLKLNERFESEGLNAEQQAKAITEDIKKYSKEVAPLRQFVLTMVKDDKIRQIFQDRDTIKQFYKKGKLGEKWQSVMFMMDPTKINPMTMPKALFDEYVEVINNIAKKLKRGQLYGTDIKMIHDFHENLFKNNEDAEIDYIAESIAPYMDQYEAALADESSDGVDNVFFRNLDKAMLEKGEEVLGEDHKKSFKKNKKQILAIVKNKSVEEGVDELDYDIPAKDQQPMWNVAADAINEYNQKSDEDKLVISAKEFVKDKLNNSKLDNDLIDMLNEKDNLEYIFRKGKYHARRDKNIETLLSTIKDIKGLKGDITENIISEREREYVRSLLSIEGKNDLLNFEAYEINQITKTLQGVETGLWLPPIALRLRRKLFANNLSNDLKTTFDNSGILPILDSFGESIPTFEREVREEIQKVLDKGKSKASLKEFIQKKLADSYGIAQLGKMKTDGLEKLMNRVYSAFETTNFLIKKPRTERANLFLKIKKKTEFNGKQYDREEINILVYMKQLQLQFDSNPNSEYVPNLYYLVKDLKINEGVKYDVNSDNAVYEESTAASLWKDFSKKTEGGGDPTLDYKKVNELLSQSNASSYFDFLNKLSTEARSMVQHTVKYSQGKAAEIFTDHVTVRVKEDTNKASDIDPFAKAQPVAKAKTSISRQAWKKAKGGYVVKKISWDAYSISSQSFEDQVRDYHLREEYLNVYSALTVLKNNLDGNGQALVGALQLDLEAKMTVASSKVMSMNSAWGSALRLNKKAILSSLSKIPSETLSNLGFAMTNPKTFSDAFFGGTKLSPEATAILIKEYGSAQINRLIDTKFYSEEVADIREDVVVRPRNAVEALDQKLPGLSNASSSIIGLSDKLVANKMWQAHVARRFKELSGIDWDNNIALEPNLRKKYEAEIRDAMAQADLFVTKRWQGNGLYATSVDFTSGGNYDTAQKSAAVVALMNWFKPFRTGMSSLINESLSQVIPEIPIGKKTYFRTQGYVSRKEAIGNLLGAVGSIMSYGFISKLFSNYLFDAILDTLMGEDDDEPLSVDMKRARNQGLIETALLSTRVGRMNSMAYGMASLTARAVTYGFESDGVEGVSKEIARNFTSGRLSETMLGGHGSLISLASKAFDGKDRSAANHMINASFVAARLSGIPFTKEYLEVIKRMYPDKKKSKGSNNFEGKNYID
jgi:hypothetical protein